MSVARNRAVIVAGLIAALMIGAAAGVGGFTFIYARGHSYLTNDPNACTNCHVMQDHFDAWVKSSHKDVAVCNDCHTPHNWRKYIVKGINGWNHSWAFTTGEFHEPLQITDMNRRVTESACRDCHQPIVEMIDHYGSGDSALECIRCHSDVGHWE